MNEIIAGGAIVLPKPAIAGGMVKQITIDTSLEVLFLCPKLNQEAETHEKVRI